MKKTVIVILCLAVLGGAGAYLLLQKKNQGATSYAGYLPQDVLVAAHLTHLNALTDAYPGSALGKLTAKDTVHAIMAELQAEPKAVADYDAAYDAIATVMTNPAFRTVFGENSTMAVLPPDRQEFAKDPAAAIRQSLVLIATTSTSGALDLFSRLVNTAQVSRETVDGLELTKLTLAGDQVVFGYADSTSVLIAYAPAAIKRCVTIHQAGPKLAESAVYKEAATYWNASPAAQTYSRVFLNAIPLAELLQSVENPDVKRTGELMQGVRYGVSVTYATAQGVESRARSTYRYDQLHPQVRQAIDGAAAGNQTLSLLGEQSLAYSWSASLQPQAIIDALTAEPEGREAVEAAIREAFGVSLDELGRTIGPQYGFVFHEIVSGGLFPIPKLTMFLGIRDRAIAAKALNGMRKQVAGYGLAAEAEEEVGGQALYSWPLLPGEAAQPAVTLTKDMFYLANGKQTLKDILTSKAAAGALAAPVAAQFGNELGERFAKANLGSFVVYPERISRQTGELYNWLAGILSTTKSLSIARLGKETRQLLAAAEYIAVTTNLGKEHGDWAMSLKTAAPKPAEQAKK